MATLMRPLIMQNEPNVLVNKVNARE